MCSAINRIIFLIIILSFNFSSTKEIDLKIYKELCTKIGFKIKTEKHADCVLKLHKKRDKLKLVKLNNFSKSNQEYSSYLEAKDICTKKELNIISNSSGKFICVRENSELIARKKDSIPSHCTELYGCIDDPGFHDNAQAPVYYQASKFITYKTNKKQNNTLEDLLEIGILIGAGYLLGTSIGFGEVISSPSSTGIDPGVLCATGLAGVCN
jgi:hypothetical protein